MSTEAPAAPLIRVDQMKDGSYRARVHDPTPEFCREVVRACLRELDEEDDLDRIYLGPEGSDAEHGTNTRLWCQDRVWGGEGIEYVRVGRLLPETEGEA